MELVDLPINCLSQADWNPNEMNEVMLSHLRSSIRRFGMVVPLVVRQVSSNRYETIGGAQRLTSMKDLGLTLAPCVVVTADDAEARLLGQALNHIAGSDNLGLRAEVLRDVLASMPLEEVMAVLPETKGSLQALASLGKESIAQALHRWEQAQSARLRHLAFQLTDAQLEVVEEALQRQIPKVAIGPENPNRRGAALYLLCRGSLERQPNS
jgi:ParB family chromosome partitioning protein